MWDSNCDVATPPDDGETKYTKVNTSPADFALGSFVKIATTTSDAILNFGGGC